MLQVVCFYAFTSLSLVAVFTLGVWCVYTGILCAENGAPSVFRRDASNAALQSSYDWG